mgnify:CR=1 FL=1
MRKIKYCKWIEYLWLYRNSLLFATLVSVNAIGAEEPGSSNAGLPERLDKALSSLKIPQESVSIDVREVTGKSVLAFNADTLRNPASTIKTVSSFVALEELGPAYRWPTEFYLQGELKKGVLKGDLLVKGYGNPYLVLQELWLMLRQLKQAGLQHIDGNLVLDRTFLAAQKRDPGAFDGQHDRVYNVQPDALLANFMAIKLMFETDGRGVSVKLRPELEGLTIKNDLASIKGACTGFQAGIRVDIADSDARDEIRLSGKHPNGCENYTMTRAILRADTYFFAIFKLLWQELGGSISGSVLNGELVLAEEEEKVEPFYTHVSPPLRTLLVASNKYSSNAMSQLLLLTAASKHHTPPISNAMAVQTLQDRLLAQKLNLGKGIIQFGSGLSRQTKVSAQFISDVLEKAYQSPYRPEFISSLPISGYDGTMRKRLRNSKLAGQAHIKTGQLDNVAALAGYIQASNGAWYIVSFQVSHKNVHRGVGKSFGDELLRWVYSGKY